MISLRDINEHLGSLLSDTMNDYYPAAIYVDHDNGSYGDAKNIVIIDVSGWGNGGDDDNDEIGVWESMTDSERQGYALDYGVLHRSYGYAPHSPLPLTPSEYMREIGEIQCLHNEK